MSYGAGYHYRGDPFLGGLVKGAFKFVKGGISNLIGGGRLPTMNVGQGAPPAMPGGSFAGPGLGTRLKTAGQALIPGGVEPFPGQQRKRKRMNPANPKALRRAIRRQDGFVKLARRALKGSGYTIVSKGSRRPKRDLGAGHTHVR